MAQLKVDEIAAVNRVVARDRLYLTADGSRVVGEGDDAADTLYAIPGDEVSRDEAVRLGLVKATAADEKSETPDDSWKVDELKAYADEHGIDLGDASKKAEILAAIPEASGE